MPVVPHEPVLVHSSRVVVVRIEHAAKGDGVGGGEKGVDDADVLGPLGDLDLRDFLLVVALARRRRRRRAVLLRGGEASSRGRLSRASGGSERGGSGARPSAGGGRRARGGGRESAPARTAGAVERAVTKADAITVGGSRPLGNARAGVAPVPLELVNRSIILQSYKVYKFPAVDIQTRRILRHGRAPRGSS